MSSSHPPYATPRPTFAPADGNSRPVYLVLNGTRPDALAAYDGWLAACGFTGAAGQTCLLPDPQGQGLAGVAYAPDLSPRRRFTMAKLAEALPEGAWHLVLSPAHEGASHEGFDRDEAALAWLLGQYRFARYHALTAPAARLVAPEGVDARRLEAVAAAEYLTRDLINTPSNDIGPDELEAEARALAETFGGRVEVIHDDALLSRGFPLIHAVGRASPRRPRLIDLRFGQKGPMLTVVGKGVCFDTGGLNLKPGASMALMKKDMGGAATVLGLAQMVATLNLPLRLRVLIPAVENAVDGSAMRPGDILRARNGASVEINNTDAEGRLILADALSYGAEENPDLLISMATLTGAARVALGPDLPPFYAQEDGDAAALMAASARVKDPLWRMPFWDPYDSKLEPAIADLDNAPGGGMAGSVTAALFLRRFTAGVRYIHFDIYGWQPEPAPARPKGGVGQGARAILDALPTLLDIKP